MCLWRSLFSFVMHVAASRSSGWCIPAAHKGCDGDAPPLLNRWWLFSLPQHVSLFVLVFFPCVLASTTKEPKSNAA
jgi:hypothetical protein